MNKKTPTLVGAGIGLALFLAIALLPAMLYGGYAGVLLAGGIFGTPVEPTLLARALIVFGMVLGVVGVGSLFAVQPLYVEPVTWACGQADLDTEDLAAGRPTKIPVQTNIRIIGNCATRGSAKRETHPAIAPKRRSDSDQLGVRGNDEVELVNLDIAASAAIAVSTATDEESLVVRFRPWHNPDDGRKGDDAAQHSQAGPHHTPP